MAAQLGATRDPVLLIPGDPPAVRGIITELARYGDLLHEAGAGLQRIDTGGWSGPAADAFRQVFHGQPVKWLQAGDAHHDAANALEVSYLPVLEWARGQAREAVALYGQGTGHHPAAQGLLASACEQLASAAASTAEVVGRARDMAPPKPGFWSSLAGDVTGFFSDAGHLAEQVAVNGLNDLASVGNAALNDPGSLVATLAGLALAGISAGGEIGGLALDATGIGAAIGVPAGAISAAGITAGLGLAGAGLSTIGRDATGPDRITVMEARANSSDSGDAGWNPPKKINGKVPHGDTRAKGRDGHGVNAIAMNDAVKDPEQIQKGLHGRYKFTGKDAVVVLDGDGNVVTAWARNSRGWRK